MAAACLPTAHRILAGPVRGARIRGRLDLDFLTGVVTLLLDDCLLDDGITAYAAHLPHLGLRRCRITHPTDTPLAADGLHLDDDLRLTGSVITAAPGGPSAVTLTGAHLGGDLNCAGTELINESGPALAPTAVRSAGPWP